MSFFKSVFKSYISNNIHVALAVLSLTKITLLGLDISENTIPVFNFFATIISYNFIKYYQNHKLSLDKWFQSQMQILTMLSLISLVFLIYFTTKIKLWALITLIPFFLASIFYVVPIASNKSNLRNVATLKLFLIAFSWTGVTVIFPLINYHIPFTRDIYIEIFQIFLFIIGITIPFDIRDVQMDNPKIRTLPQIIGIRRTKLIGLTVLLSFFILEFLKDTTDHSNTLIKLLISIISMGFLVFSNDHQPTYYSSFWIESLPILWLFLVIYL